MVGGGSVNYPGGCRTPMTEFFTVKLLLNATISIPGARFMNLDIKYFYLITPIERYEYMQSYLANLPEDITE